ncbi:MAG: ABC transporter permease [Parasporobacterium sp.]|nr:ABC transporter permease [Parasporobacterium sp.]
MNVQTMKKRGQFAEVWGRLRKNKLAMISLSVLLLICMAAIFADLIANYNNIVIKQNGAERLMAPCAQHWFGTDEFGRDIFARIIHGARMALLMGFGATIISVAAGLILACVASYFGGVVDMVIMRVMDVLNSVPALVISLAICSGLGAGTWQLIVALSVAGIPIHTRMIRSNALGVMGNEYIEAAKSQGASTASVIFSHMVPNIASIIIIQITSTVATNILMGATLSFIGLGVKPPRPEWGLMLSSGTDYMLKNPHMVIFPGIAIILTALSVNTFGDCLRDAFDPKLKGKA